jgi:hypothetical protein
LKEPLKLKYLVTIAHRQKKLLKGLDMQVRVKENAKEFGSCGCGRSPTGKCCGWHGLTEDQYQQALEKYMTSQQDKEGKSV